MSGMLEDLDNQIKREQAKAQATKLAEEQKKAAQKAAEAAKKPNHDGVI